MANDVIHRQRLRGSSVQNDEYTGLEGEITVDLTSKNLRLHDGQTIGGTVIPNISSLADFLKKTGDTMTGTLTFSNGKTISDYLPLSGGTITGTLILNAYNAGIKKFSNTGILTMFGGTDVDQGGSVRLYGKDHGSLPSQVMIGTGSKDLVLKQDGTMTWAGKEVERVASKEENDNGCIRYENGLQICWNCTNGISLSKTSKRWDVSFQLPFIRKPSVSVNVDGGYSGNNCIQLEGSNGSSGVSTVGCGGYAQQLDDARPNVLINVIAVGWWK